MNTKYRFYSIVIAMTLLTSPAAQAETWQEWALKQIKEKTAWSTKKFDELRKLVIEKPTEAAIKAGATIVAIVAARLAYKALRGANPGSNDKTATGGSKLQNSGDGDGGSSNGDGGGSEHDNSGDGEGGGSDGVSGHYSNHGDHDHSNSNTPPHREKTPPPPSDSRIGNEQSSNNNDLKPSADPEASQQQQQKPQPKRSKRKH